MHQIRTTEVGWQYIFMPIRWETGSYPLTSIETILILIGSQEDQDFILWLFFADLFSWFGFAFNQLAI